MAKVQKKAKVKSKPDSSLRDYENIPLFKK